MKRGGRTAWLAWLAAALFYLYEYFVRVAPCAMESELRGAFAVGASTLGLASGLYYVAYGPLQMLVGPIYDHFGYRRPFCFAAATVCIGCFIASAPACGVGAFAAGRVLMGIGSAFAFIGTIYVASLWFPRGRWAFLSGLTTALGMGGAILGQGPVVRLVRLVGWRNCWIVAGAAGLAVTAVLCLALPDEPDCSPRRMAAAVPLGRGLGRLFSHASGVLKNPQTWLAGCIGCALFMPLTVFADYWGIHYVELLSGTTTARAAAANGMLYVGWLLGSPLAGRLSDHLCRRKPFLVCGCASSSILLLAIISMRHIPLWAVGSLLFLLGLLSSPEVICFTMSGEHNSSGSQGTAIAAVNTVVMLLGGIMQPAVGYILDHCAGRRGESVAIYSIEHFQRAFLVLPVAMAIGLALSLIIRESGKRAMN